MKKLLLTISLIFSIVSFAGTVDKTYSFKNISISENNISGQQFHIANFENTLLTGKTGEPVLPYYAVKFLLPPGMEVE